MHRRLRIWDDLRILSVSHLKAVREEDWDQWERILRQKEALYREIEPFRKVPLTQEEKRCIGGIKTLEEEVNKELMNKREEARLKIIHFKEVKAGAKGYRQEMGKGKKAAFQYQVLEKERGLHKYTSMQQLG